jgi:hypothetical protein
LRISILQPEACGKQRRLRHGHPPRAVLGTTDCCRLLGWYATLVFQDPALCLRPGSLKNQESRIPQPNCIPQDLRAKTSTMLASPVACKSGRREEHGWAGVWNKSCWSRKRDTGAQPHDSTHISRPHVSTTRGEDALSTHITRMRRNYNQTVDLRKYSSPF